MASVVFEGGTFRGVFSAGVMDALLDNDIHFDYVIGVSAGIAYGISFVSKQKGRNLEVVQKYKKDPRYYSKRNILRHGSLFGWDFIYDEIPNRLSILDREAIDNYTGKVLAVVTNAQTGQAEYLDAKHMDKKLSLIRASSAIPFYSPAITIDGRQYYDGGLSDSIPIKKSLADGNTKHLIVMTQPKGYEKKQGKSAKMGAFLFRRKFPKLSETLLNRARMYNDTLEFIQSLESENKSDTVVLRPAYNLNPFESNIETLEKTFQHGYDVAMANMKEIQKLVK